jgi:hypothetical protein
VYRLYPRKEGKSAGMKICRREIRTLEDLAQLERAVRSYLALTKAENRDRQHVKHFATFMGCWRDYLDTPAGANAKPPQPAFNAFALEAEPPPPKDAA